MDDLISRQAAMALAKDICVPHKDGYEYRHRCIDPQDIAELPSAERRGKWIKMSDADGVYWACSECGEDIPRVPHYDPQFDLFPRLESIEKTNFCPNCGAKMITGKDDTQ